MKKSLIVGIIVLFSFSVMAQSGFRPGFIIKNNGDTLNGLVFYGSSGKFKKSCLFKRFEIAQEFDYSPGQIKAFGLRNGRYFESKTIGRKEIFLECIVKGDVSIYVIPGKYKGSVYVQNSQTGLFKLDKGSNQINGGGNFGNFREALTWMLNKTGNQQVSLDDMDYDAKEIASVVRKSSAFSENSSKGFMQTPGVNIWRDNSFFKESSLFSIGLNGGYQFVTVNTPGNGRSRFFTEALFNKSYRPAIGLYVNSKFSKISDRWSVDLGLLYLADSYYGYSEYSEHYDTYRDDIMIDFSEIQVPLSLHVTFGKGAIRPFIRAGGFMSFLIDQSYARQSELQQGDLVYTDYYEDFTLNNSMGLIVSAGIQFKMGKARIICLEGGYSKGKQTLSNSSSKLDTDLNTNIISIMARINL
jgi:hypothetical protein